MGAGLREVVSTDPRLAARPSWAGGGAVGSGVGGGDGGGGCRDRAGARLPGARGRRDRRARPRRLRRAGARLRAGAGRALPAGARGGGHRRRRRGRADGVPARGQRRPVRDDRQAARRTPDVGSDAGAQRCLRGPSRHAAARGHLAPDDDQVRPLGEHAAHLRRRLRRRGRRSGRRDRAPVRRPAGTAGRVRPTYRPEHLDPAGRGGARRQGGGSGRRRLRGGEAHRRPRPGRLGGAGPDRVGRWRARRRRGRLPAGPDRRGGRRARRPGRHAAARPHRGHRVPAPARDAAAAGAVRRGSPARPRLRRAVRGDARRARHRQGLPRHDGHDRRAHGEGDLRGQPARSRRHRRGERRAPRRPRRRAERLPRLRRRSAGGLPRRHRQGVRRVGRRPRRRRSATRERRG